MGIPEKTDISRLSIDELTEHMKDCISYFCLDECYSHCCQTKYIETSNPSEVRAIFGLKDQEDLKDINDKRLVIKNYILRDNEYTINLTPCPQLERRVCLIHDSPDRPKICKNYPIFKESNLKIIEFSVECPAFLEGLFEQYYPEISKRGYEIRPYKQKKPELL